MEGFVGEIRIFSGSFAPQDWAFCNGQMLNVKDYPALFSLIGTQYGGNGVTQFALPDLRARLAIGAGQGPGLSNYTPGQKAGVYGEKLAIDEMPIHTHSVLVAKTQASVPAPTNALLASMPPTYTEYVPTNATGLTPVAAAPDMVLPSGSGLAHENTMPSLGLSYIIALTGLFPTFN